MRYLTTILLISTAILTGCASTSGFMPNDNHATEAELELYAIKSDYEGDKKECIMNRTEFCSGLTVKESVMKWGEIDHTTITTDSSRIHGWNLSDRTITIKFLNGESVNYSERGPIK